MRPGSPRRVPAERVRSRHVRASQDAVDRELDALRSPLHDRRARGRARRPPGRRRRSARGSGARAAASAPAWASAAAWRRATSGIRPRRDAAVDRGRDRSSTCLPPCTRRVFQRNGRAGAGRGRRRAVDPEDDARRLRSPGADAQPDRAPDARPVARPGGREPERAVVDDDRPPGDVVPGAVAVELQHVAAVREAVVFRRPGERERGRRSVQTTRPSTANSTRRTPPVVLARHGTMPRRRPAGTTGTTLSLTPCA